MSRVTVSMYPLPANKQFPLPSQFQFQFTVSLIVTNIETNFSALQVIEEGQLRLQFTD